MIALEVNNETASIELKYSGGKLVNSGLDLETAILISLFSDARKTGPLDPEEPRSGWWADTFSAEIEGQPNELGSQLWTVDALNPKEAPVFAKQFILDALKWLIDDGHAKAIDCEVSVERETLLAYITITLLDGEVTNIGPFKI